MAYCNACGYCNILIFIFLSLSLTSNQSCPGPTTTTNVVNPVLLLGNNVANMKSTIIDFLLLASHKMWLFKYEILKSVQLLGPLPPDPHYSETDMEPHHNRLGMMFGENTKNIGLLRQRKASIDILIMNTKKNLQNNCSENVANSRAFTWE